MTRILLFLLTNLAVPEHDRRVRRFFASMAGALRSLLALQASHGAPMPPRRQAFGIHSGEASVPMHLFMSHPPLAERIAALQEG